VKELGKQHVDWRCGNLAVEGRGAEKGMCQLCGEEETGLYITKMY
jgi:hypothetical protein